MGAAEPEQKRDFAAPPTGAPPDFLYAEADRHLQSLQRAGALSSASYEAVNAILVHERTGTRCQSRQEVVSALQGEPNRSVAAAY